MSESPTDKNLKEFGKGILLGISFGVLFGGLLGVCLEEAASEDAYDAFRQQAVERGFAEWHLIHAHSGETEFRWLDKPKDSLPADH